MTENWKKSGKKSGRPGVEAKAKSQKLGSCQLYRQSMLSSNRTRELNENDYGKRAQKTGKTESGIWANPRRTIITGASPKETIDPKLPY